MYENSNFTMSLLTLVIILFLKILKNHPSGCEMVLEESFQKCLKEAFGKTVICFLLLLWRRAKEVTFL